VKLALVESKPSAIMIHVIITSENFGPDYPSNGRSVEFSGPEWINEGSRAACFSVPVKFGYMVSQYLLVEADAHKGAGKKSDFFPHDFPSTLAENSRRCSAL